MVNPLKYDSGDLRVMTDVELGYAIYQILNTFASTNTGTGTLNTTGTGTSIGSFSDTERLDPVGTHPVGTTVNTTTTTLYQDLTAVSESLIKPVEFSSGNIKIQNDTQLNDSLIAAALDELVDNGLGVYRLQPTSPTEPGTWVSIVSFTNTTLTGDNTTYLWRRTGAVAPSKLQPLKATATGDLKVMTDAELQSLTNRLRNRIISTGIGQYKLQSTTPTGGTWVKMGLSFYDTIHDIGAVAYTGYYNNSFTGYYSTAFTGFYANSFTGNYYRYYAGRSVGPYTGSYGRSFTGYYSRAFTGYYSRSFTGYYSGTTVLATTSNVSDVALWIRTT